MTNDERIEALAQEIYLARHNQANDVTGDDLTAFLNDTIIWVNQLIPEVQIKTDWNSVRTNDDTVATVADTDTLSYALPELVRKLVVSPYRDIQIRQDGAIISTFKLVNPNQTYDPNDHDVRSRATVLKRRVIFSRKMTEAEVAGTIVADTIAYFPQLSHANVELLDILDEDYNFRQVFIFGVLKNQLAPDIVQGGLTPTYALKFDSFMADAIAENGRSADSNDVDRESLGWVGGVGF